MQLALLGFILLIMCVLLIVLMLFAKDTLSELDRLSVLLTVMANKQGCTQEDIDVALGKATAAKKAEKADKK